ncbi:MAG: DUF5060 domain-containing protein [Anaerolineae bacterium]|nr:DUF5060 domain-containing protein [Thermoflexales bacterium]MDW8394843.1 DUF5060 domain-containing protein [Anaerolineae bacterium]
MTKLKRLALCLGALTFALIALGCGTNNSPPNAEFTPGVTLYPQPTVPPRESPIPESPEPTPEFPLASPAPLPAAPPPCPVWVEQRWPDTSQPLALAQPLQPVLRLCRLELVLHSSHTYSDPYDPERADMRVRFVSPKGESVLVPAFWFLHQRDPNLSGWRVRFAPPVEGEWQAIPVARGEVTLEGAPVRFQVIPREAPGYVRLNPRNPRYLAFDNGQTFFPIGLNLGWWRDGATSDFARWINALADNGGNVARVWMAPWSFAQEWKDTGLGNYNNRQLRASWLDQVFDVAQERGVYLVLTLISDREYRDNEGSVWAENPYNAANGGPLQDPRDFVTHPEARRWFARRLRYIAARWGYSPNLLAWEYWNEVEATRIETPALMPWLQEMTAVLREADPNRHLVTLSYVGDGDPFVWRMPEIDLLQRHEYNERPAWFNPIPGGFRLTADAPDKPLMFGEFGFSHITEPPVDGAREGIHLHNSLWASAFNGFATTAMYWWWEDYVEAANLWHRYRPLALFLADEDLATFTVVAPTTDRADVVALGLVRPDRALLWMRSTAYDHRAAIDAAAAGKPLSLPRVVGLRVGVGGLNDGTYRVDWFDPQTGQYVNNARLNVSARQVILNAPSFDRDLAAKITPLP